jgi:cell division protein FtsB
MQRLGGRDRNALVLRYFERRDLHSVGAGLGVSEEAARKRVSRALEKLRVFFKRRGLNFSASTLAALLAAHAVTAAPTGIAASISGAAITSAAVGGGTILTLIKIMTITKLKLGVISAIAVAGIAAPLVVQNQSIKRLRDQNESLTQQNQQFVRLDAENERLTNLLAQSRQSKKISEAQFRELLRLRGEVGLLRKDSQELAKLRGEGNERARASVNAPDSGQNKMIAADTWADVGMETPDAAMQTFFWAARHDNAELVGNLIRWQKDASVPEFDGLDNIVTNLIPGTIQFASEVQGLRILSQPKEKDGTASVQVEFAAVGDQPAKTADIQFVKEDTQWKPVFHLWSPRQGSIQGGLSLPSKP